MRSGLLRDETRLDYVLRRLFRRVLPTITVSSYRAWYICGGSVGQGRYFDGHDAAAVLGLTVCATWPHAKRLLSPRALFRAVANSTALTFSIALARAVGLFTDLPTRALRYASLYSGAFDTLLDALRLVGYSVTAVAAAESSADLRAVLRRGHGYESVFATAEAAVSAPLQALDFLSWTPPCVRFSRAALLGVRADGPSRIEAAVREIVQVTRVLRRAIRRWRPAVVLGEEVAGLVSHCAEALAKMWRMLSKLPYFWAACVVDAAALGSRTTRVRYAILGIRRDMIVLHPPRAPHPPRGSTSSAAGAASVDA